MNDENYYLFKESDIQLLQVMITELQKELNSMFLRKKWTFSNQENCRIKLDFDFLASEAFYDLIKVTE